MKVKEESEKVGLKLNIQKTKIMASSPMTSWQIDEETVETVADFIFWGSKITADGDCSHEIKRRLLLGRKVMTNLDSIFKSRDISLSTKVHLVKAMIFPVVMYGCESQTMSLTSFVLMLKSLKFEQSALQLLSVINSERTVFCSRFCKYFSSRLNVSKTVFLELTLIVFLMLRKSS